MAEPSAEPADPGAARLSPPGPPATRPVAVDAMGGDRAPAEIVAGAIQAAEAGLAVVLVGDPDRLGDTGGLPVIPAREIIEMHEDPGRAVRTKKDSSLVRAAEAVRDGTAVGHGQRRQHRGHHGQRPVPHGPHPGRGPAGDRHADSGARDDPDRAARRRRQRRVHRRLAGAVRPDGLGLRQTAVRDRRSPGRAALDRRGTRQGQPPGQGDVRPARGRRSRARRALHRQRRRPRRHVRRRRRGRHRRLHRQRGPEDPGRLHEVRLQGGARGPAGRRGRRPGRRGPPGRPDAAGRPSSTPTPTAAPCCSASTACASSATGRPRPGPSSTPSGVAHHAVREGLVDQLRAAITAPSDLGASI